MRKGPFIAPFDVWAEYYDIIHKGLPGEAEFYVGQAVRFGGPVLEIGCGTGRIAIPMAMAGIDVVGLDNSRLMLARCRQKMRKVGKLSGRLRLVRADMTDFSLDRRFRFIAMPYRTFMHLMTCEEQRGCLAVVRRHLADDGVFILNLWAARPSAIMPHLGAASGGLHPVGRHKLTKGEELVHYCCSRYDEDLQLLDEDHVLHVVDTNGKVLRTQMLPLVRTWLTCREMDNLVHLCGYEVEALLGDFDGGPFTRESSEMIWVLRKGHVPER